MTVSTNAINNTVGASISGVTNTFTVTNPSNTASSQALCLATVGGGTSGDAFYQAVVSGTTSWSWGVDNSASDAFVVAASAALGTTNIMSASTAGEINYPLQPSFSATTDPGTAQDNVTGNGANYTVLYPTEIFDQNSDYSSPNFTAPVTGRYLLVGTAALSGLDATSTNGRIIVDTSNRSYENFVGNFATFRELTANTVTCHSSGYADMDAADTSSVRVNVLGMAGDTVDIGVASTDDCRFMGFLHA